MRRRPNLQDLARCSRRARLWRARGTRCSARRSARPPSTPMRALIASHIAQSAAAISAGPLMMPPGRSSSGLCGSSSMHSPRSRVPRGSRSGRMNRDRFRSFCSLVDFAVFLKRDFDRPSPSPRRRRCTALATPRLLAVLAQRAEQRHQDARARRADRMAERAGAAVHVDLVVRQAVLLHRRHRHHGERLVDLVQVDVLRASSRSCSIELSRSRRPARW